MKTPREILFEHHSASESKLDAIRRLAVVAVCDCALAKTASSTDSDRHGKFSLRELAHSLRWHLAGMSAAWLFVALLNIDRSPEFTAAVVTKNIPVPKIILAALRENRRQLAEMIGLVETREVDSTRSVAPQPHSQRREETMTG